MLSNLVINGNLLRVAVNGHHDQADLVTTESHDGERGSNNLMTTVLWCNHVKDNFDKKECTWKEELDSNLLKAQTEPMQQKK